MQTRFRAARWPLLIILLAASSVWAGAPADPYGSPDVVVATVRSVADDNATRGNPPRVELRIDEVLRGDGERGTWQALWNPPPHDIDTGGREAELKRWNQTPMRGPRAGEKLILFGHRWSADGRKPAPFHVRTEANLPFTEENRAKAIEIVNGRERAWRKELQRREDERRARDVAERKWRAGLTPDKIQAQARAADLVVIGQVVGNGYSTPRDYISARIDEVLKWPDGAKVPATVLLPVFREVHLLLERDRRYVVFAMRPTKPMPPHEWHCEPAPGGDGIAPADEAARAAVATATTRPVRP